MQAPVYNDAVDGAVSKCRLPAPSVAHKLKSSLGFAAGVPRDRISEIKTEFSGFLYRSSMPSVLVWKGMCIPFTLDTIVVKRVASLPRVISMFSPFD